MLSYKSFYKFVPLWLLGMLHGASSLLDYSHLLPALDNYGASLRNELFIILYLMLVVMALNQIEEMFGNVYVQMRFKNDTSFFIYKEKLRLLVIFIFVLFHQALFIVFSLIHDTSSLMEILNIVTSTFALYGLSIIFDEFGNIKSKSAKIIVFLIIYINVFQYSQFCIEGLLFPFFYAPENIVLYTTVLVILIFIHYLKRYILFWPFISEVKIPFIVVSIVFWLMKTRLFYVEATTLSDYMDAYLFTLKIENEIAVMPFIIFVVALVTMYLVSVNLIDYFNANELYLNIRFTNQKQYVLTKKVNAFAMAFISLMIYIIPIYFMAARDTGQYLPYFSNQLVAKIAILYLALVLMINVTLISKTNSFPRVMVVTGMVMSLFSYVQFGINLPLSYIVFGFIVAELLLWKVGDLYVNSSSQLR